MLSREIYSSCIGRVCNNVRLLWRHFFAIRWVLWPRKALLANFNIAPRATLPNNRSIAKCVRQHGNFFPRPLHTTCSNCYNTRKCGSCPWSFKMFNEKSYPNTWNLEYEIFILIRLWLCRFCRPSQASAI